jgi:hypothetical protein
MSFARAGGPRKFILGVLYSVVSLALIVGSTPAYAGLFDQDANITQANPDYVLLEAEWFDRVTSNSMSTGLPDPTLWSVNFFGPAGASGGRTLLSPTQADNNNPANSLAHYSITFSSPGIYNLYAYRIGGGNDSMFPPPDFNANPNQTTGGGLNQNRWNSLADNTWSQLGVTGDFPNTAYFATGARTYEVTAAEVGMPLEFRVGPREANTQIDRFALHKTGGLTNAALNALSLSNVVINNPVQEPTFTFAAPAGLPPGGFGTIGVLEVTANGTMNDQANAHTSLQATTGTRISYSAPMLNIRDSDGGGNFANDALFRSDSDQSGAATDTVNNISLVARGTIRIPTSGNYTFGVNSDDGFTLMFPGRDFTSSTNGGRPIYNGNRALQFFGGRGVADTLGVINLPAGDHPFLFTFHEGGGGAAVEFFAAAGSHTAFAGNGFQLVGSPTGLQVVPEPSSIALVLFGLAWCAFGLRRRVTAG